MYKLDVCLNSELAKKCLYQQVRMKKINFTDACKRLDELRKNNIKRAANAEANGA